MSTSRMAGLALVAALAAAISGGAAAKPHRPVSPAPPPPADPAVVAAALRDKALDDSTAYGVVESLTTEVGQRLAGTPAAARAKDWALAKLTALGFSNVHAEPFAITAWIRGAESAEVTAPYPQTLVIIGLGASPPTPPEGIEAEIALFHSYADLLAAPPGSLTGKIAVVTQPMTRTQDGAGYGAATRFRRRGPVEAARRGAVAYLVRSISTSTSRSPHTGKADYVADVPKIPAAALGVADAELLDRMVARGKPVRIRLALASTETPGAPAWNVSGDIVGSEKPDEAIVIGGHLDSWDPGQGAIDDATGVAITTAAAKLIGDLPRHPRRTIRVVMFGSEEMDYSGRSYADAHKADAARLVALSESDSGPGPIWNLQLPRGAAAATALKPLASLLAPLKVILADQPAQFAGADFGELQLEAGVPVFSFTPDTSLYFDVHHSADDTLDKVGRPDLNQSVAAWAALIYLLADSDVDLRALAKASPAAAPRP